MPKYVIVLQRSPKQKCKPSALFHYNILFPALRLPHVTTFFFQNYKNTSVREDEKVKKVKFYGLLKWGLAFFSTSISALEDKWKK